MTSPGVINWLRIAFIAMIWGGAFMVVRIALRDFEPLTLAAGRITIGAIALFCLMHWRGHRLAQLQRYRRLALCSFGWAAVQCNPLRAAQLGPTTCALRLRWHDHGGLANFCFAAGTFFCTR
jgi:drug/metabolite transporter (DMT)-like permease